MDDAIHHCNSLYTIVNTNQSIFCIIHVKKMNGKEMERIKRLTMGNAFEASGGVCTTFLPTGVW